MIAFIVSSLLIITIALTGNYILTPKEMRFVVASSILYIFLFGLLMPGFKTGQGVTIKLLDDKTYTPLIFYIIWYVASASLTNIFTGSNNYQGFFQDSKRYMSTRRTYPL